MLESVDSLRLYLLELDLKKEFEFMMAHEELH